MPRPLKVYGADIMLRRAEREALGLPRHIGQGRGVIATTSMTAARRSLGVGRDYIGETGNRSDIEIALVYPGRVVLRPSLTAQGGGFVVREGS